MALNYHTTRLFLQTNNAWFLCSPTRIPNSALSSWKASVEKWAPVLSLRPRIWSSISSCISSTKGRKLQPWIDATTAPVEFSLVLLPCHVMKIIPLGDHCQEIAGVGHQAPSCTGWSRHVDAFVLRRSPPYSYELIRRERRNCWLSSSWWHFDKRGVRTLQVPAGGCKIFLVKQAKDYFKRATE
jgi:hypothetical protein